MPPDFSEEWLIKQSPEVQAIIRFLVAQIAELKSENAELKAEIARLKKTPQNSSLPPSSQHPHAKPAPPKPKSKKRRGGQPGHPRYERALIPAEECQAVLTLKPEACRRCQRPLFGDDPEPLRHQLWELPEIKPLVTEYQRHRLSCPGYGESTRAAAGRSAAGPGRSAAIALGRC
jgi:transposase